VAFALSTNLRGECKLSLNKINGRPKVQEDKVSHVISHPIKSRPGLKMMNKEGRGGNQELYQTKERGRRESSLLQINFASGQKGASKERTSTSMRNGNRGREQKCMGKHGWGSSSPQYDGRLCKKIQKDKSGQMRVKGRHAHNGFTPK